MGVTFIGNPFDQETEYDDSDWEMNAVEEWIMPPQEIAHLFDEDGRATVDVVFTPEEESEADDEFDEDSNPDEDDNYDFENSDIGYVYDSNEEDEEEIDYVTFPLRDEETSEADKPIATDTSNTGENRDTD